MSEQKNDHFNDMVLMILVVVLGIAGILFAGFLFWPYFVFYVLPLVIGSLAVGGLLRLVTLPQEGSQGLVVYKNLAVVFPVLIFIVMVACFANSERSTALDKNGKVTGMFLDWPKVNKTFNEYRSSTYAGAPFDSLKAAARAEVVYDRQEIGWIALWCLFLGGPAFFWYLTQRDQEQDAEVIKGKVLEGTKRERERVLEKERGVNEIIAKGLQEMSEKVARIERERSAIVAENRLLKAKVEFSPDVPKPPETVKTGGILDSDIL
jgi:hypothetical protein